MATAIPARAIWALGITQIVDEALGHQHQLTMTNTIVGTADELEDVTEAEVLKFSAGGFRDFTRIAASDPTMWRDIFLNNRDAVLEMLGRFNEDLAALANVTDQLYFRGNGRFFTVWSPENLNEMDDGWKAAQTACRSLAAKELQKASKK